MRHDQYPREAASARRNHQDPHDADGELGESYTATLSDNAAAVRKAANLGTAGGRTTAMGELMLGKGLAPHLTCTVAGTYDESDYQEN
ncbi:hypothetical protein [Stenotrophomonas sp. SrG]|uniref:hypothetical protein n=1 Tax=Stenotrophomonas sp. SrG TaxID=3414430 RepID=UPI003CFB74EC